MYYECDKFTRKWFYKNLVKWCGDLVPEMSVEQSKTWNYIDGGSDCVKIRWKYMEWGWTLAILKVNVIRASFPKMESVILGILTP
jgi:hypothetical protein